MRNRSGFVLVEVLMNGLAVGALIAFLTLIGVQSVLAIPRWSESRDRAHLEAVRWSLENVVARQALHRADTGAYTSSLDALGFRPSEGVMVDLVASAWGWSATARHDALASHHGCAFYLGSALPPSGPVTPDRPGGIACTG